MRTIGELIDAVLVRQDVRVVEFCRWIDRDLDKVELSEFRSDPITADNVHLLCVAFAGSVRECLGQIDDEDFYDEFHQDGKNVFELIYKLVENQGIARELVSVPITESDILVSSSGDQVRSRYIYLTRGGKRVAEKLLTEIEGS